MNRLYRLLSPSRLREEGGFSLIELMAAIGIFSIVMTAVASTLSQSLRITRLNRQRSVAANLAAQEMDAVRATEFAELPLGQVVATQVVDDIPYTVTREAEWITQNATSNACEGVSGSALAYLRVNVFVSWQQMNGVDPVESQTVITPPTGAFDPTKGHIAVTVHDRDAGGQSGVKAIIDGPGGLQQQFTTSEGCAFFPYLTAGSYTVTLDSLGFVDGQGVTTPSQPATVNAGTITAVGFDYDEEATLSLTLQGSAAGPVPNAVPVTVGNTKLLPLGTKTVPGTGSARTVGGLFPYGDGYHVWAGECADADPEGLQADGITPFYPGATRDPALSVTPGGTTAGTVTLPTADVIVTGPNGITPVAGATVVARHPADNGCAGGEQYTLGVTDATGTVPASLPYGDWEFTVNGRTPAGGTWPTKVLAPPAQPVPEVVAVSVQ
jgi:prepilin-type N-terminal cleavage/methylation domain-containing protein